jgi:hypothetical protein
VWQTQSEGTARGGGHGHGRGHGQSEVGKVRWAEQGHRQQAKRNKHGHRQTQSEGTARGGGRARAWAWAK